MGDRVGGLDAVGSVAREVMVERGVAFDTARSGSGWTNATWLAGEYVIRVARRRGPADLLREISLVRRLPAEVGYPKIVDAGVRDGFEWVLTRRIAADNLEDAWPRLTDRQRADAIRQVWSMAECAHQMNLDVVAPHARSRSPFFPESTAEVIAAFGRLGAAGLLSTRRIQVLTGIMHRFEVALPNASKVLNHGDLGMCNALWDGEAVVALLDFEFASVAPLAVDLNEIIKFSEGPSTNPSTNPSAPSGELTREEMRRIVRRHLAEAGGIDVLLGYSVMLETWLTENEMSATGSVNMSEMNPAERDPRDIEPYQLLAAIADDGVGHLAFAREVSAERA